MKPITTFLCAVLLMMASQVCGQNMSTSFTAVPFPGQPPYPVGSRVKIDLNVTNFTKVSSVLLPIVYNSTVLRFDSIDMPILPGYSDTTVVSHPTPGIIKLAWFPSLLDYPDGFTLVGSNTRMLTLFFTVLTSGTGTVNLSTTVPFTPIEVVNSIGNNIYTNAIFQNGGGSGASIVAGSGNPPPPPLVGFKAIANTVYAQKDQRVCVPITVNDFDNLILMQYAMHWDSTKLTYDCFRENLPGNPTFNRPKANTLLLSWEDPNLTGVTVADGTRIYDVCFNTIGAPGTSTIITLDGLGFPDGPTVNFAEVYNASSVNVWSLGGTNGASGISDTVFIMSNPPQGNPVTFTADQDVVSPGAQTCVDVKVKNFTSITESEFQMTYDATKLTFVGPITIPVTALNLTLAQLTHTVAANVGTIKFKWTNAAGATVADNTTIFSVCFNAIGATGNIVPIAFGTAPCPAVVPFSMFKKDVGGVAYKFENGQISILSTGPTLTPTNALCFNASTGAIATNPNGTASSFSWSNGMTTQNLANVAAGTYTVTVTYAGGNTATATASITAPTAISMTQAAVGVTCFGDANGSIDITPSGGTAPYTYLWNGPTMFTSTTQDVSGLKTGNYVVTITDANLCAFASAAVNVPQPQPIAIPSNNVVISTVSCFGGSNGAISITPQNGTPPYTYDWSNDMAENPDNDPQNVVGLMAGSYNVTITDSRGCSFTSQSYTISQPQQLVVNFVKKDDAKCFNSATGKIEITVGGGSGNKTYSWKTVPANTVVSPDQNPNGLAPGTYNVLVTDANGCTATLATAVTIGNAPSALTLSNTTQPGQCFGQLSGSIDLSVVGGWGGYTYAWPAPLQPIQDHSAVSSGTYTVTVTDQGLCTATQTVMVGGAQTAITIGNPVVTNVTCFGQATGAICIVPSGGNGGTYQVAWSSTAQATNCIANLTSGNYVPTVSDVQGCTAVFAAINVTAPTQVVLDTNVVAANPMGSIDLMVTGGTPNYSYSWSNGAVTQDINGVAAGTYTVTVTDNVGCSKVGVYTVPSSNVVTGTLVTTVDNSCNNDGCIHLSIPATAAGASPYTLSWTGGTQSTTSLTPAVCGLAAGAYVVTVTASNGNTATVSAVINQLQQALVSTSTVSPSFDDLHNGSILLVPSFPNCTFLWGNGSTALSLSSLDSGLYVVTVTNTTSGCTSVYQYPVTRYYQDFVFSVLEQVQPSCLTSTNGSIKISVVGGNGPTYTYKWSGPNNFTASTKDITGLKPGAYFLTITDESGVPRIQGPINLDPMSTLVITNVNELSTTPSGFQVSGATVCDGEAAVVFSGNAGATTILWSNNITSVNNFTLCGGAYSVTVTDNLGCTAVWSDALTAPMPINATYTSFSPKCFGGRDGTAKVYVVGGAGPYQVKWSNGQVDQLVLSSTFSEAVSLEGGAYTVTITDANGVTKVLPVEVPDAEPIEVSFTGIDPNSYNSCDGERIAFVTGAAEPISYTWASNFGHNGSKERAEGLCAGEVLSYVITDNDGCSISVMDTVPYPEDGCFRVRPVLTPEEQDGNNDFTLITCIETVKHTVEIYNRWGQLVFQTTEGYTNDFMDPINTWTGVTRTGQSLPEGVYYYVLTFNDDEGNPHQLKGHINLLK